MRQNMLKNVKILPVFSVLIKGDSLGILQDTLTSTFNNKTISGEQKVRK